MLNNKINRSDSSSGLTGMHIKSARTNKSSFREEGMLWNEIKNHHNPCQFDHDDDDDDNDYSVRKIGEDEELQLNQNQKIRKITMAIH